MVVKILSVIFVIGGAILAWAGLNEQSAKDFQINVLSPTTRAFEQKFPALFPGSSQLPRVRKSQPNNQNHVYLPTPHSSLNVSANIIVHNKKRDLSKSSLNKSVILSRHDQNFVNDQMRQAKEIAKSRNIQDNNKRDINVALQSHQLFEDTEKKSQINKSHKNQNFTLNKEVNFSVVKDESERNYAYRVGMPMLKHDVNFNIHNYYVRVVSHGKKSVSLEAWSRLDTNSRKPVKSLTLIRTKNGYNVGHIYGQFPSIAQQLNTSEQLKNTKIQFKTGITQPISSSIPFYTTEGKKPDNISKHSIIIDKTPEPIQTDIENRG